MIDKHHVEITYDDYITTYSFINSLFSPINNFKGHHFEPGSFELEFVRTHDEAFVWTKIFGEDGSTCIVSGYREHEGMAFFISNEPVPENTIIEVKLD
jgi:hypothetical protein